MEVTIKKNHFIYNGVKYFRKAAESLNLGSYGNKDKNVFVSNGLIHDDTVKGKFPVMFFFILFSYILPIIKLFFFRNQTNN